MCSPLVYRTLRRSESSNGAPYGECVRFAPGRRRRRQTTLSLGWGRMQFSELSNRVRAQQIVDAADRQSAVTDCKSHPLGSTAAAIATGKDSRQARFECLG